MMKSAQATAKQLRRLSCILDPDDVPASGGTLDCNLWRAAMVHVLLKRFTAPDETRSFEKGTFEVVRLGGLTVGRASYEPGWKWSTHVGPLLGHSRCQVAHVGMVISGRAMVAMEDGTTYELAPGDLFAIAPGHDSWVIGEEPYISLHFLGAEDYAQ
jgi:mannose-6-phosphate isomerase-like protein (cupin superfamily)